MMIVLVVILAVTVGVMHVGGGRLLLAGGLSPVWRSSAVPQVERWLESLKSGGNKPTSGTPSA